MSKPNTADFILKISKNSIARIFGIKDPDVLAITNDKSVSVGDFKKVINEYKSAQVEAEAYGRKVLSDRKMEINKERKILQRQLNSLAKELTGIDRELAQFGNETSEETEEDEDDKDDRGTRGADTKWVSLATMKHLIKPGLLVRINTDQLKTAPSGSTSTCSILPGTMATVDNNGMRNDGLVGLDFVKNYEISSGENSGCYCLPKELLVQV